MSTITELVEYERNRKLSRDILPLIDGKDIKRLDEIYGEYREKEINYPLHLVFEYAIADANIVESENYIEDTQYLKDSDYLIYSLTRKNIKLFKGIEYIKVSLFKYKALVDYFRDIYGVEQILTVVKKLLDKWMDGGDYSYYDLESLKFLLIEYKLREHPLYEEYIKNVDSNKLQKLLPFIETYHYEWNGYHHTYKSINFAEFVPNISKSDFDLIKEFRLYMNKKFIDDLEEDYKLQTEDLINKYNETLKTFEDLRNL